MPVTPPSQGYAALRLKALFVCQAYAFMVIKARVYHWLVGQRPKEFPGLVLAL